MSRNIEPRKSFFVPICVSNMDGTIDLGAEGLKGYETEAEAIAAAKDEVDENDVEIFVYECRPLKRLYRVSVVIEDIKVSS